MAAAGPMTSTTADEKPLYMSLKAIKYILELVITRGRGTDEPQFLRVEGIGRESGDQDQVTELLEYLDSSLREPAAFIKSPSEAFTFAGDVHVWMSAFKKLYTHIHIPDKYFDLDACRNFNEQLAVINKDAVDFDVKMDALVISFQSMVNYMLYGYASQPDAFDSPTHEVILVFEAIYYLFALAQHIASHAEDEVHEAAQPGNKMSLANICIAMVGPTLANLYIPIFQTNLSPIDKFVFFRDFSQKLMEKYNFLNPITDVLVEPAERVELPLEQLRQAKPGILDMQSHLAALPIKSRSKSQSFLPDWLRKRSKSSTKDALRQATMAQQQREAALIEADNAQALLDQVKLIGCPSIALGQKDEAKEDFLSVDFELTTRSAASPT